MVTLVRQMVVMLLDMDLVVDLLELEATTISLNVVAMDPMESYSFAISEQNQQSKNLQHQELIPG